MRKSVKNRLILILAAFMLLSCGFGTFAASGAAQAGLGGLSVEDGYSLKNAYKDLQSASQISAEHAIPMPVLAAATATYQSALQKGFGEDNKGGMIKVFEQLLGVEFRK